MVQTQTLYIDQKGINMENDKKYSTFQKYGDKYVASAAGFTYEGKLTPGVYSIHYDGRSQTLWFESMKVSHDSLLDLPSNEYSQIIREMEQFLKPETKEMFKEYGFIYKRSALLYGNPGTGKTSILHRVNRSVVKSGGIVLYCEDPRLLPIAYSALNDIQPEILTTVVFEEFDAMANQYEKTLLSVLDGEIQKDNVMYLATTNFLEKVPKRLYRPGRFSSIIEVGYPNTKARNVYFSSKLKDQALISELVAKTKGLSVDEMKEIIQSSVILKNDLDSVIKRLQSTRDFDAGDASDDTYDEVGEKDEWKHK